LVHRTSNYDESKPNQWLDDPPLEIWDHVIIPMLGLKDLALARPVCTFFEAYWQDKFSKNVLPLIVGNDVATIDDVMGVIEILSSRREYTKINPFVVLLGKGEHQITSNWTAPNNINGVDEFASTLSITRSNITFLGKGIDTTTILGGFYIEDFENITFKNMTVTYTASQMVNGSYTPAAGISMKNAKVELFDVALRECGNCALHVSNSFSGSFETTFVATRCEFSNSRYGAAVSPFAHSKKVSARFNNCVFNDNSSSGIYVIGKATIHLHGEATAIHSNGTNGIYSNYCKVFIHLPSDHNTFYNNGVRDRHTSGGSTITNVED